MGNEDLFNLTQKLTIFGTENTLNLNADTEEEKVIIKEITTKLGYHIALAQKKIWNLYVT